MIEDWWRAHELEVMVDAIIVVVILVFVAFVIGVDAFRWLGRRRAWKRRVDEEIARGDARAAIEAALGRGLTGLELRRVDAVEWMSPHHLAVARFLAVERRARTVCAMYVHMITGADEEIVDAYVCGIEDGRITARRA